VREIAAALKASGERARL